MGLNARKLRGAHLYCNPKQQNAVVQKESNIDGLTPSSEATRAAVVEERAARAAQKEERKAKKAEAFFAAEKAKAPADAAVAAREEEKPERQTTPESAVSMIPEGATLQVQLDSGWADCAPEEAVQIRNQLAGGQIRFLYNYTYHNIYIYIILYYMYRNNKHMRFTITARGTVYVVDFTNPDGPLMTSKPVYNMT